MKIKACGYVCGTFGHLARSFGEFHLRIWPRHLILFIYLFVAAQPKYVRRDNISHFVPKKEEWVIFTPPPFFTCTHRQTHTHALSPVAPPLSFLPHCTHTHTRTHASKQTLSMLHYTLAHTAQRAGNRLNRRQAPGPCRLKAPKNTGSTLPNQVNLPQRPPQMRFKGKPGSYDRE